MKSIIIIDEKKYTFLKRRDYTPVYVYQSGDSYLKIGSRLYIDESIASHTALFSAHFPVSKIIKIGTKNNQRYFIESSLGSHHFGYLFEDECKKNNQISPETFSQFMKVTKLFADAQSKYLETEATFNQFKTLVHYYLLIKELPHLATQIKEAYLQVKRKLKNVPLVLSHGDFNPHNIYPQGLNDSEKIHFAPYGYDLITNLVHVYFFPTSSLNELMRGYEYTPVQREAYIQMVNSIAKQYQLSDPFSYINEFIFCRAIWSVTRQQHTPRYQKWSYTLFTNLLSKYLQGEDLWSYLLKYEPLYSQSTPTIETLYSSNMKTIYNS